jgi:N-acetyl-gamma-glutamyl-phosphate reductase
MKIKIAIAGGAGYTAGELLRILLRHPNAEVKAVLSTSQSGPVHDVHKDLLGDTELRFTPTLEEDVDVLFLCLGHGMSRDYLAGMALPKTCKVIDLGNDFRLDDEWEGERFVYGLSELRPAEIAAARCIANPGCFATAILLPLLPLAGEVGEVHVTAITGSTGAGRNLTETGHFSNRSSNISVYKPFTHQHLGEIRKTLAAAGSAKDAPINFVPMRGDFTRGIFASIYTDASVFEGGLPALISRYKAFYEASPFVHISDEPIALKQVVNTNKALIHMELHNGYVHFTSVIDNLLKGASGQAVQNMNLMFGLPQDTGLKLKANFF